MASRSDATAERDVFWLVWNEPLSGTVMADVDEYHSLPLAPGLAFALDPQLWVHEDELYVRVEDTVAITADGCERLTRSAPL